MPSVDLLLIGAGLLLGFALTPIAIRFANAWGLLDTPGGTLQIHTHPTPRSGGVAIAAGLVCVGLLGLAVGHTLLGTSEWLMAILLFGLGLWDDRDSRSPRLRMVLQVLIYSAGFALGLRVTLGVPLMVEYVAGLIVFIAVINGINFYDGLDGLLSLTAIGALTVWAVIAVAAGMDALPFLVFVAILLGFISANWYPARIFLGDGGSFLVGFFFYMLIVRSSGGEIGFLAASWVCALPVCDAIAATVDRGVRHQNMWEGDRDHIYDILSRLGLSTPQVAGTLAFMAAACTRFAAWIPARSEETRWFLTIGVYVLLAVGIFVLRRRFRETTVAAARQTT